MPKFDRRLIPAAPDLSFETGLWSSGIAWVAGIDEAGRGALAGPVAAAAVILPVDQTLVIRLDGVRDSKELSAAARQLWETQIKESALSWQVGWGTQAEIDSLGIVPTTRLAARRALDGLALCPGHLLVDYLDLPGVHIPQTPLIKGDARSLSIACASILAKTARDAVMVGFDQQYPGYGFARHKGYGTAGHVQAIDQMGLSPVHRRSFHISRGADARSGSAVTRQ